MLTHGVINAQLAQALAGLRHKDRFVVSDAGLPLSYVPHDGENGFKAKVKGVKFVIRTGETTSYSNVIFRCGVPF